MLLEKEKRLRFFFQQMQTFLKSQILLIFVLIRVCKDADQNPISKSAVNFVDNRFRLDTCGLIHPRRSWQIFCQSEQKKRDASRQNDSQLSKLKRNYDEICSFHCATMYFENVRIFDNEKQSGKRNILEKILINMRVILSEQL